MTTNVVGSGVGVAVTTTGGGVVVAVTTTTTTTGAGGGGAVTTTVTTTGVGGNVAVTATGVGVRVGVSVTGVGVEVGGMAMTTGVRVGTCVGAVPSHAAAANSTAASTAVVASNCFRKGMGRISLEQGPVAERPPFAPSYPIRDLAPDA